MKKFFFGLSLIAMVSLTSCGAQQDCRGRGSNYKLHKQTPAKMLAVNTLASNKIK